MQTNGSFSEAIQPLLPTDTLPTGQELLRLLRLYENSPDDCDLFEQVVDLLQLLISTISRRGGLFYGSDQDAQTILENASAQAAKRGTKSKAEDRKSLSQGPTVDSQLLVSAILRILNPNHPSLLVALAADLINTICQTIRIQENPDTCTVASFEIMATCGKQLLQQLSSVGKIETSQYMEQQQEEDEGTSVVREAALQAAAALVTLFGIKLSRSTDLLNSLSEWAWNILFWSDESKVQIAAARLLTALPSGPRLEEVMSCLLLVLVRSVPTVQQNRDNSHEEKVLKDSPIQTFLQRWIDQMSDTSDNTKRGQLFLSLVHGLTAFAVQLFQRPGESNIVEIHVQFILQVVETMMTFPLTAETSFHGTNKRLRAEYLDGGLLNTIVLARDVANVIFIQGLALLDGLLAIAPPLSYTRNIYQIVHAGLRTTSSASVRQVVDPSSAMQFTGSRRRWLHRSIPARVAAIQSFRSAVLACGPDPQSSRSNSKQSQECSRDVEQSVQYLSGFLIESLKLNRDVLNTNGKDLGEWGSTSERYTIMADSARCLTSVVLVTGEYLSLNMRNLIESITFECLKQLSASRFPLMDTVNNEILRLASACAQVPWRDGAASSLSHDILRASALAVHGPERIGVSATEAAYAGFRTSESAMFSRIPALSVVRSRPVDENMYAEFSMLSRAIMEQIKSDSTHQENTSLKRVVPLQESEEAATSKKSKLVTEGGSVATARIPGGNDVPKAVIPQAVPRGESTSSSAAVVILRDEKPDLEETPAPSLSPRAREMKPVERDDESDDDLPMIFDGAPDDDDAE